jgi:hypothetical protein
VLPALWTSISRRAGYDWQQDSAEFGSKTGGWILGAAAKGRVKAEVQPKTPHPDRGWPPPAGLNLRSLTGR